MAADQTARVNCYLNFSGTLILNLQLREANIHNGRSHFQQLTRREMAMSSRQTLFAFLAAVLINLLQLMYQGKEESPFETRPKTMFLAIMSLFVYCFACDAKLRVSGSASNRGAFSVHQYLIFMGLAIFGPLSLASISSLLLPENFGAYLYLASIMYSLSLFPISVIKRAWNWFEAVMQSRFCLQCHRRHRRRGEGIVSVRGRVNIRPPL